MTCRNYYCNVILETEKIIETRDTDPMNDACRKSRSAGQDFYLAIGDSGCCQGW